MYPISILKLIYAYAQFGLQTLLDPKNFQLVQIWFVCKKRLSSFDIHLASATLKPMIDFRSFFTIFRRPKRADSASLTPHTRLRIRLLHGPLHYFKFLMPFWQIPTVLFIGPINTGPRRLLTFSSARYEKKYIVLVFSLTQ